MQVPSLIPCVDTMLREERNKIYDGIHVLEIHSQDYFCVPEVIK